MTLEKSSKGTLELVEKMMFIRMMQRMKLVTLATSRKAQAQSSKSGGGREAGGGEEEGIKRRRMNL